MSFGCAAFDGAGDWVGDDAVGFGFDKEFGGSADDLKGRAVHIEEVGGGVDRAEVAVDVERVEGCGAGEALGGDCLDDVAEGDVGFEGTDVAFVASAADVGGVGLIGFYWGLRWERDRGGLEGGDCGVEGCAGGIVGSGKGGRTQMQRWDVEIGDDLDFLVEMVEGDDGIEEHKQRLWDLKDIFQGTCCFRFEVADTIVADVANCSSSQRRENETRDRSFMVLSKLFLEDIEGVGIRAMTGAGLQDLPRVLERLSIKLHLFSYFFEAHLRQRSYTCLLSWGMRRFRIGKRIWSFYCRSILLAVISNHSDRVLTDLADILRYAASGVRKSDGIVAQSGTRFGGLGDPCAANRTSSTISNDGWNLFYTFIRIVELHVQH